MSRRTYRRVDIHRTITTARSSGTQLSSTARMNLLARETVANTIHLSPGSYFLVDERLPVDLEPFRGYRREHCEVDPIRGRFDWPEYSNVLLGETSWDLITEMPNVRLEKKICGNIITSLDVLSSREKKSEFLYYLWYLIDCNRRAIGYWKIQKRAVSINNRLLSRSASIRDGRSRETMRVNSIHFIQMRIRVHE